MTAGRDSDNMQAVLFCDFDGTITIEDLIVAVWRRFAKAGWERQMEAILDQQGRDYVPFDTFFDVIDGLATAPWNAAHILNRREP